MNQNKRIFGAKALVHLKFDGNLKKLSKKISDDLNLPKFFMKSDPDPPHDISAYCGCLGFDIVLSEVDGGGDHSFVLTIRTEHSLQEEWHDQMHDLSPWFARFLTVICDIETNVPNSES